MRAPALFYVPEADEGGRRCFLASEAGGMALSAICGSSTDVKCARRLEHAKILKSKAGCFGIENALWC